MRAYHYSSLPKGQADTILKKLLGSLELEVMDFMWQAGEATVQQVVDTVSQRRPLAYTTVMTVMGHLVDKGLLSRTREGKRYRYRAARSCDEFLQDTTRRMVRSLVDDFGNLAIAQFLGEMSKVDADRLEQLRGLVQEAGGESNASK
jgi:predicted transcriptional regulator